MPRPMTERTPPLPITAPWSEEANGQGRSWAHVSGWALLSGTRRTVSCIVICRDQAEILVDLLPALSDMLTECGYPWETIAIDCDSTDETQQVLARWDDLPGFRYMRCDAGTQKTLAVAAGLSNARGDAVILVDAAVPGIPNQVPGMILRWEAGAALVCAVQDPDSGALQLLDWDDAGLQRLAARNGNRLPAETTTFSLFDRRLVNELVGVA